MTRAALLFPGQGNLPADLDGRLQQEDPKLHELIVRHAGAEVFDRADDGQRWRQPALFATSMGCWRTIERAMEAGELPVGRADVVAFAGHSLGEVAALVAAGSLAVADAVEYVCLRGRVFHEVETGGPPAAMCALVGDGALAFAESQVSGALFVANDNSPQQVIVSGGKDAVRACRGEARAAGLRAVMMPMKCAGHSAWMEPVVDPLAELLSGFEIAAPSAPVWSSALAQPFGDVRAELATGCVTRVRWRELVLALADSGADLMIDVGPGHVLAAQAAKTLGSAIEVLAPCDE